MLVLGASSGLIVQLAVARRRGIITSDTGKRPHAATEGDTQ